MHRRLALKYQDFYTLRPKFLITGAGILNLIIPNLSPSKPSEFVVAIFTLRRLVRPRRRVVAVVVAVVVLGAVEVVAVVYTFVGCLTDKN